MKSHLLVLLRPIIVGLIVLSSLPMQGQISLVQVIAIGRNAIAFRDYVVAIEHFNQAIQADPKSAEAYYYRAFSKLMLGDYIGAEQDATLCIERNPFLSRAYMVRGGARHNQHKWLEAAQDYTEALKIQPDDFHLAFNLAGAYYGAEQFERADSAAQYLIKMHQKEPRAYVLQAEIKLRLQDTVGAEQAIQVGLQLDSLQPNLHRMLATLAYQREDYHEAINEQSIAMSEEPNQVGDYINRGLSRYKIRDYRGAMADYDHALLLAPQDATARHNRALLRVEVGDIVGAREDFLYVVRQQSTNLTAHYNLALVQVQTGQYHEAIETLDYILGRRPEFIAGYYQRSELKRLLGDSVGADKDYWLAYKLERGQIKAPKSTIADSVSSSIASEELYALEHHDQLQEAYPAALETSLESSQAGESSNLRGAIQEQQSSTTPAPLYELSYFSRSNHDKLLPRSNYSSELEAINQHLGMKSRMILSIAEAGLDSTQLHFVLQDIETLKGQSPTQQQTAEWQLRMGVNYLHLRDVGNALQYLLRASEQSPQQPITYLALSVARLMQAATSSDEEAALLRSLAIKDLTRGIALSPQMGYLYYNRAVVRTQSEQINEAIKDYGEAIRLLPSPAEAYFNRALLYERQGKYEQAIQDLSRAGELGIYRAYANIHRIQSRS